MKRIATLAFLTILLPIQNAISWNEEKQIPQAWIFDAHLLDQGRKKPRVEEQGLEVLQPEIGSKPRVYYKNLHLMTKCFVSGSVVVIVDGVEECAEDAEVVLSQNGSEIARAVTDMFGEFKIDKLEKNSGHYVVSVNSSSYGSKSAQFNLSDESSYLGVMTLEDGT